MRRIMIPCLLLVLLAGGALGRDVVVTRIGDVTATPLHMGEALRGDCLMGNLNPPAYAITDWIWGAEGYKYLFYPPEYACCPPGWGFRVELVHMYVQFGAEDVPAAFEVFVDLEDALWDPASGCWVPGIEDCVSPVFSVTIDVPGLYDIAIPLFDYCECAFMDFWYFLSFHFVTAFPSGMEPDAVSDQFPFGCTSYNDYGAGWLDLVNGFGWPGEILIWADVFCCDFPIGIEPQTWGRVKTMYR
jgi:hypothetical protein